MKITVLNNTLDEEQTNAAISIDTNSIIIAGAGSGKSLTIVGKIKYLVNNYNININDILCITFTNKAALSLQEKITKEIGTYNKVYTFHKLALEILNENNISYLIASQDLLDYLVNEIFNAINNQVYFKRLFLNKNYLNSQEFINYKNTITKFIRLLICNNYDINLIIKNAKRKDKSFLKIIKKIYEIYAIEKNSSGTIDFDDMILLATKVVQEKGINKKYKYIIIDEYQDTSNIREELVKAIINKTKAYLTVVGDDFQSIYRFTGCDLNNFLNFKNNFYPATIHYITNTYRNSNELIKVAGSFITKNKNQIKKDLKSSKSISKPFVIFYYNNIKNDFIKALDKINSSNLLILGRNNKDIDNVLNNKIKIVEDGYKYKNKNFKYLTIHKSKGLEEDNIIIINLTNSTNSLPSKIKEESILRYVTKKDIYPFEEERRLFYVAITRTKNYCYLFIPKKNSSIFIKELIKHYKKYITIINL